MSDDTTTPVDTATTEEGRPRGRLSNTRVQMVAELDALRDEYGVIHARAGVRTIRNKPASLLYSRLEWNDTRAGEEYRIHQLRQLINIYLVEPDTKSPTVISLSVDRAHGGGYRPMDDVLRLPDLREIAVQDALDELDRAQKKYQHLQELNEVWRARDQVREEQQGRNTRRTRRTPHTAEGEETEEA
jgi:hypothetical protein